MSNFELILLRHGETPANVAADLKLLLAGK